MRELLRIENISFQYENKFLALKNVSATFFEGERIAVLGNNGAGKSTFFLCCNGVLRLGSGSVYLKGRKITNSKEDILSLRKTVGLVFQEPDSQIIAGTVESEVSFGPVNLKLSRNEVSERVTQSLETMGLERYRSYAPQYLSGGEKKRVSIADILAMRPELMLFDEPTASLDPENVAVLEQTLDKLSSAGIAIVVSTHDVDFAYRFADRAVVFSCGEIVADAGIDGVFASEDVIYRAGLKKPSLYEAAEALERSFPEIAKREKPKNIEEFREFVSQVKLVCNQKGGV